MTINNKNYSSPQNINLKGGLLRFNATQASNPFGDVSYGLYVNDSGELIFRSLTTSTTLGTAGGGSSAPTLDAIYAGDKSLAITAGALTLAGAHASNDVLLITNASGSGDCIQVTNSGTGNDIEGTGDTWHFTKAGDFTANKGVMAGDAGSDSLTLTAGDVVFSDGSVTITDADDATTLSITNDSCVGTGPLVYITGAGTYTGTDVTSFVYINPSGLVAGTAFYLLCDALEDGLGAQIVGDALTSGALLTVSSSSAAITSTTGGLLSVVSSGATATGSVLAYMSSAAADDAILLQLLVSDVFEGGSVFDISAAAMTTGTAIDIGDLSAVTTGKGLFIDNDGNTLTTGKLIHIDSGSVAITTTGRMFLSDHTGNAGSSATLNEFKTVATDETVLCKLTAEAMATGKVLDLGALAALTTGTGISIAHTTSVIANGGSLVKLSSSSVDTATTSGTILDIANTGSVAGTLVRIYSNLAAQTGTTGLEVKAAGYTTGYTGSLVQFTGCGTTGDAEVLLVTSANTTAGQAVKIVSAATTTNGSALNILAEGLTTGVGLRFAHTTSVIADGGSMVRLSDSGVATGGTTNGTILDIINTGSVAGTLVKIFSNVAAQTATCLLDIVAAGYTTGYTGSVVKITGVSTTGAGAVLTVTGANTTAGTTVTVDAAAVTTGTGLLVTSAGVIVTTGELVSLVANGATTCTGVLRISATALTDGFVAELTGGGSTATATGGVLNLAAGAATDGSALRITTTGIYIGTAGIVDINATETTTGTVIDILNEGRTTGDVIKITTNTTGTGNYIHCYDGAATDFKVSRYGAVTIAGNAIGTAALTMNNGDLVMTSGNLILTGGHIKNTPQAIVNANTAISIATLGTTIANDGASTHTLADGTVGQLKYIVCTVYTGDAVITPSNFVGSTITLNAAGDSWLGVFVGTEWVTLALGGTAAVA
jgi:hypothetical protein